MKIGLIRGKEPVSRLVMKPETMMKVIGAAALAGGISDKIIICGRETEK